MRKKISIFLFTVMMSFGVFSYGYSPICKAATNSTSLTPSVEKTASVVKGYRDTLTIVVGSPIPAGWVILSEQSSSGKSYYLIQNLNGASARDTFTILSYSPIPSDWVILSEQSSGNKSYYLIKYLKGISIGSTENVVSYSPIPTGWVVISKQSIPGKSYSMYLIKRVS